MLSIYDSDFLYEIECNCLLNRVFPRYYKFPIFSSQALYMKIIHLATSRLDKGSAPHLKSMCGFNCITN
jgi:hypothetical protein